MPIQKGSTKQALFIVKKKKKKKGKARQEGRKDGRKERKKSLETTLNGLVKHMVYLTMKYCAVI